MIDVVILFFLLGLGAGLARSDLKLPSALYDSLSLFLLLAIGLKGGKGLARQPLGPLLPQLLAAILLGVALCARALAEAVLAHVQARYYADYAMVAFLSEIEILRPEKF